MRRNEGAGILVLRGTESGEAMARWGWRGAGLVPICQWGRAERQNCLL